jgi:hypothetical protein
MVHVSNEKAFDMKQALPENLFLIQEWFDIQKHSRIHHIKVRFSYPPIPSNEIIEFQTSTTLIISPSEKYLNQIKYI